MNATRTTQPYRKGTRSPGAALTAMLRGRTAAGWNPQDVHRAAMLRARSTGAGRAPRPTVTPRKPRAPR